MPRFTYAVGLATLTTATTIITTYWSSEIIQLDIGWRITIFLMIIIGINIFGVKVSSVHYIVLVDIILI